MDIDIERQEPYDVIANLVPGNTFLIGDDPWIVTDKEVKGGVVCVRLKDGAYEVSSKARRITPIDTVVRNSY